MALRISSEELVTALRAAGEPSRLRLLALLAEGGDLTVKDLTEILAQSQPRISQHLKRLTEAGLIERFPEGAWAYYALSRDGTAGGLAEAILSRIAADDPVLARDRARLSEVKAAHRAAADAYFASHAADWDRLRSLHVPEAAVEKAMLEILGSRRISNLLDCGTGTGRMLELLHPHYGRALGFDMNHDMLSVARRNLNAAGIANAQVRHGDIYDLGMLRRGFDLVTINQVLHYLDDPARAVREAARALSAGGRLLVVDFAPHSIEALRESHAHRRLGFAHETIRQWLEAAGLTVTSIRDLAPPSSDGDRLTVTLWLAQDPHFDVAAESNPHKEALA